MQVGVAGAASGPTMVTHGLDPAPPTLSRGVVRRRWIAYRLPSVRVLFFGTFDEGTHPRVRALREGIELHGHEVTSLDVPLGLGTGDRVRMAQRPWRAPILLARLASCWVRLWRQGKALRPDVVVVPYLGHFDVHLARRRFPRGTIVLDHMVSLGDTVRDRGLGDTSLTARVLDLVDRAALRVPPTSWWWTPPPKAPASRRTRSRSSSCRWPHRPPGSPPPAAPDPSPDEPVRIVFFGLYTPLQGAPDMGASAGRPPGGPARHGHHGRRRPGPRRDPLARGRRRPCHLDRLGRRRRAAGRGRRPPRLPRDLRHRPEGAAGRPQQGPPGRRGRLRDRHVGHPGAARGPRRRRGVRPGRLAERRSPTRSPPSSRTERSSPTSASELGRPRRRGSPRRPRSARCSRSSTARPGLQG